jgi:hypothetical protein
VVDELGLPGGLDGFEDMLGHFFESVFVVEPLEGGDDGLELDAV